MFLTLSERVLADLVLFVSLPAEYVSEFCNISLSFLESGPNADMIGRAAASLGVAQESVSGAVMALTFVLLEAAKANLALWEFTGSLADISLPEATRRTMAEFYIANASRIRTVLTSVVSGTAAATAAASEAGLGAGAAVVAPAASPASIVLGLPAYRGLEWRLAVSLGSRLQPNTIVPSLTLRLDTSASTAGRDNAVVTQAHPSGDASAAVTTASVLDKGAAPVASVYFQADAAALAAAIASLEQAQAEVKTANMRRMMRYLH